ncbi:MAG: hypothetical protein KJI69_04020 [Patescibacteria group bacterium]|nr:hypothetical protein [Patescibacteria group bacterium]
MANGRPKKNPLRNVVVALTVVITIGAVVTIGTFLSQVGILDLGFTDVLPIAEIPVVPPDDGTEDPIPIEPPTTEELIDQFLRSIGVITVETFGIDANIRLVDSNLEEQIERAFLKVQPLDPREVIVAPEQDIDPSRFFINTDFSTQLADNGRNYHKFSGWDVVNEPRSCSSSGGFSFNCPVPIVITTTKSCTVKNTGLCILVTGQKNDDDDVGNNSIIHGLQKTIDISDWTKEGDLIFDLDYSCNPALQRSSQILITIKSDFGDTFFVPCALNQHFTKNVKDFVENSNEIKIEFGGRVTNVDRFNISLEFNNAMLSGNSVLKRQAIETLESFSIVQNEDEDRILDLGFIDVSLIGLTLEDNEKVVANGVLEVRIDDKTITTHKVTGNGVTVMKQLPLRIEGQNNFIFELSKQFFDENTFHTLNFLLNDFVVNIGEGEQQRTFEYHTPFLVYSLELNVKTDEIVAFSAVDRAISVAKSETIFNTCGLSSGDDPVNEPEVLPPVVSIIQNGFTIATTNPEAGKIQATDPFTGQIIPNTQFCSTIPNLPTGTDLTFKIENSFLEVSVPITQKNYFVNCDRSGCTSNIGFVSP